MIDSLLVFRQHLPSTLRQGFFQSHHYVLHLNDGAYLQITAQDHRIEQLGLSQTSRLGRSVDRIDADIRTARVTRDTIGVVDQRTAGRTIDSNLSIDCWFRIIAVSNS